ncbi:hypothetical protein [Peribacillus frigoritolerans]|uniref:hypothetical protein n=1 Tax=Peribacillus frigoritolerans TaxID=450367 RepID=UPI00207AF899|nr:hypothetical protein [Peribacillus frigoritolerans]USK68226.1 hypothetical protein LIT26_29865 [Peribacillus frigoritolerans]
MNLNGIKISKIDISLIVPIYIESVTESAVQKRIKLLIEGEDLPSYPVVEKDKYEEKYWLVSGYLEYLAYKHLTNTRKQKMYVTVIEQVFSNITTQRIKLLRKMFQDHSNWFDKHYLLSCLLNEDLSIEEISKKIGVTSTDINNYLIHREIPENIIEKAHKNKGSFRNIEKIRRLNSHRFVKYLLYERAVLPKWDKNRLTTDKLQKIQWLLHIKEFKMLNWQGQCDIIQKAFIYKEILLTKWEEDCLNKLSEKEHTMIRNFGVSLAQNLIN